jgi:hypothetical protein
LHYFSHWITPDALAKRFSTRFFIARMPAGANARHDDGELTDGRWMTAANALEAAANKQLKLHFPTRKTLQQIAAHASVDAMIEWADRCSADGVRAIHPDMSNGVRDAAPGIAGGSGSRP